MMTGQGPTAGCSRGHDYPTRKAMCEARRAEYVRLLAEEGMNLDWQRRVGQFFRGRVLVV